MFIEHVIEYHLYRARELEGEFILDRRRTRVMDEVNRLRQVAYTMRRWPDFVDFTENIGQLTALRHNPFLPTSHRG